VSVIPLPAGAPDDVRDRAVRLFTFLREYTQLRARTVLTTEGYDEVIWLAEVPRIAGCFGATFDPPRDGEIWIEVRKPRLHPPPPPSAEVEEWLDRRRLGDSALEAPARREPVEQLGGDESLPEAPPPDVMAAIDTYTRAEWAPWAERDRVLQQAQRVYTDLFRIHQSQQRLGEAYEVVLGIGQLAWRAPSTGTISRHVLVAQAEVRFDADRGVITVAAAADGAEPALEQDMLGPDERPPRHVLDEIGRDLSAVGDDLFADPTIVSAVRRWAHGMSARARFDESMEPQRTITADPCVRLAPALILRRRSDRSIVQALAAITDQLKLNGPIPEGVRRLVDLGDGVPAGTSAGPPDDEEVLFPLPANDAQLEIVRRLRDRPGVLVQGPPGTGKSHTIANLVAHLLAHGRRVLVTSHTARALEVLRDRIPAEIRELAVVVLGDDARGRDELQVSVRGISERYAGWNPSRSRDRVGRARDALAAARAADVELRDQLRALRERDSERHPPAFGGYEGTVQDIARQLGARAAAFGWLPDPIDPASTAPLTDGEAVQLLELLRSIDADAEAELAALPMEAERLPAPETFTALLADERSALVASQEQPLERPGAEALAAAPSDAVEALAAAIVTLRRDRQALARRGEPWVAAAADQVAAGLAGRWRTLERTTADALTSIRPALPAVGGCRVTGLEGHNLAAVRADAEVLLTHLQEGGGLGVGPLRPAPVRRARHLVESVRVDGMPCRDAATLSRLVAWASVQDQLDRLDGEWAPHRVPGGGSAGTRSAEYEDVLGTLQAVLRLERARDAAAAAVAAVPALPGPDWEDDAALSGLLQAVESARRERRLRASRRDIDEIGALLPAGISHPVAGALHDAVRGRDDRGYEVAYRSLEKLDARRVALRRRKELLARLTGAAPRLASALAEEPSDPAWDSRLPALSAAWNWSCADSWLAAQVDPAPLSRLERDLDETRHRIERTTRTLAAELAWSHCLSRLTERERAHLETWEEAVRKIGKGTGKHAPRWRRQAREAMQGCRSAIPAWIMPVFKVAEAVDMAPEAFDIVIVDEASQSGPEALFLQYLARKVIVVGDDQQISPENVGVDRDKVQFLNAQYLRDVPLAMHYDADTSYFTHAAIRYGDRLVLQEHFRCMPEIIQFSNALCYRDRPLVPLRQFGSDRLRPAVQARHVVDGVYDEAQINEGEARAIADQVVACLTDPAYVGKTFGVISLVGSEQARLIGRLLAARVDPAEIEHRRLLCGDAYAFQGDERDVMFLSLVQAPRPGHRLYAATSGRDRRRFNVAASRARDQLWLFHSATLDDLHPDGVAHRLLQHCLKPAVEPAPAEPMAVTAWRRRSAERRGDDVPPHPFDSWLELDVFLALAERGFRVIPQHELAGYRIDLLVEGLRSRVAVECEGDRWHGSETFDRDMALQRMLQRCGLPFSRVRGAAFYRDAEAALASLWADLLEHDITPQA
jgi:hypothetical protein